MKPFQQFSILLNKYFLLRRRQPTLLLLEVLWPLLVFFTVAIIRLGVPPSKFNICQYPSRDMPSAGLVPFIQSFVCNLNNDCETKQSSYNVLAAKQSMETLSKDVSTILNSPAAENAFSSVKNIRNIIKALDNSKDKNFRKILENGVQIGELFKDSDEIKRILVDELGVFSEKMVDALLKSKLDLFAVLSLTGYVDLKGIVCNGTLLKSYVIFPNKTNITEMAQSLCNIDSALIPNITEMIQKQLNMARILKKVSALMEPYKWAEGIGDIGKMIEVILKMPVANNFLKNIIELKNLPGLLDRLPKWISTIQTFEQVKVASSAEILQLLDPFLKLWSNNQTQESWGLFKKGLSLLEKFIGTSEIRLHFNFNSTDLKFGNLFTNKTELEGFLLTTLKIDENLSVELLNQTVDVEKLINLLPLYVNDSLSMFLCQKPSLNNFLKAPQTTWTTTNGTKTFQEILCQNPMDWNQIDQLSTITNLQQMLHDIIIMNTVSNTLHGLHEAINKSQEIPTDVKEILNTLTQANIGKIATPLLMLANGSDIYKNVLNIGEYVYEKAKSLYGCNETVTTMEKLVQLTSLMLKTAAELPNYLRVTSNNTLRSVFSKLYAFGPNVTQTILTEMVHPKMIQVFLENNHNVSNVLCKEHFLHTGMIMAHQQNHPVSFCTPHDVQAVQKVLSKLPLDQLETLFQEFSSALSKLFASNRQKRDTYNSTSVHDSQVVSTNPATVSLLIQGLDSIYQSVREILKQSNMSWAKVFLDSSLDNLQFLMKAPLNEHYMISSFSAYVLEWGPKLEKSPVWMYIGPVLKGGHIMIEKMNYQFARLKDLGIDSSHYISQIIELLDYMVQYGPDFLPSVFNIIENPHVLDKLKVDSWDVVGILCSDQQIFQIMQLPPHVPVDRFQSLVCGSNLTLFIVQFTSISQIPLQVNQWFKSNEAVSLNWSKFISDIKLWFETLPTVFRPEDMRQLAMFLHLSSFDKSRLLQNLAFVIKRIDKGLSSGDLIVDRGIAVGKILDESHMVPVEVKRQMKYYLLIFNIYLDVTKEFITLWKENMTSTMVPSGKILVDFLNQSMSVPKEALQIFQNTYVNYEEVFVRLITENALEKRICNNLRLPDILVFPAEFNQTLILKYEGLLCALKWTDVANHLEKNAATNKISQAIHLLGDNPNLDIKLNWTELSEKTKYTIKMLPTLTKILRKTYIGTFYHFFLGDQSVVNWMASDNSILTDNRKMESAINETLNVVSVFLKTFVSNNEFEYLSKNLKIFEEILYFIYQSDMNNQINNLIQLFSSDPELLELIRPIQLSPVTANTLLKVFIKVVQDPQSMVTALMKAETWDKICTDEAAFTQLFGKQLGIQGNLQNLQRVLCKDLLSTNLTRLIEKLRQHMPELDMMAKSITQITANSLGSQNVSPVSSAKVVEQLTALNRVTGSMAAGYMNGTMGTSMTSKELLSVYQQYLNNQSSEFGSQIMDTITSILEIQIMPQIQVPPQQMRMMLNSADNFLKKFESMLPDEKGDTIDMNKMFDGQPQLQKMYKQMEEMPEVVSAVLFNVITNTDNDKYVNVLNSASVEEMGQKMCNLANNKGFARIGCSVFDLNRYIQRMCTMDYEALQTEMTSFVADSNQGNENQLNSIEQATDIEPLMKTIEKVWKKMPTSSEEWSLWKPVDMWMNKMPTMIAMKDELIRMAPKIFNLESMKYLEDIFGMFNKMMPSMRPLIHSADTTSKVQYYIFKFVNLQLARIQEEKKFVLSDLLVSKQMQNLFTILENSPRTLALLQDTLIDAFINPSRLMPLLSLDMKFCSDVLLFTKIFTTDRFVNLGYTPEMIQSFVCSDFFNFNSSQLLSELHDTIPGLPELISGLEKVFSDNSSEKTNFPALANEIVKFQNLLSSTLSKPIRIELGFNISWIDRNTYLMVAQESLHIMQSLINKLNIQSFNGLLHLLDAASTTHSPMANDVKVSLYIQQHFLKFLNRQLAKINGTSSLILVEYVNSKELEKLLSMLEFRLDDPEVEKILFDTALHLIQHQTKLALLFELNTWKQMCSNHTVFSQIFVTNKMKQRFNITALHHVICNIVNAPIDFQKLLKELMDNVDGFKELFNALTSVSHASRYPSILPSGYLSILKEMEQFQKLLLAVITHPPVFQIDRNSNGTMGSNYFYILRKLMLNWNNLQNDLVQNSYNANVRLLQKWLLTNSTDLSTLKTPLYSINKDLLVQYYALDFINKELTKIKETNSSPMIQFLSSFDVKNLLELIQSSPQSGRIVLKTVIKLIEEPTKLLHLLDSNKWSVVCQNVSVFREMFALDTSKQAGNDTVLQSMFCKDVLQKVNFNKLLQDLQSNKNFQQMFTLVSDVLQSNLLQVNHSRISLSQFINAHITFQNIVNSLNWQKTLMLTNNTMVSQFLQHLKAEWSKYTNSRMLTGFPLVFPVIDKLWTSIYDFLPISFKWQHQQYYIQVLSTQKVLEFINLHLEQLNGTTDLKNYFQSPNIAQFIDLLEQSPTLVDLLLSTFWQMIQQPQKISLWFQDSLWLNMCSNITVFQEIFVPKLLYPSNNITHVQAMLCNDVLQHLNITSLIPELLSSIHGLPQLLQELNQLNQRGLSSVPMNVNYTSLVATIEKFQKLAVVYMTKFQPKGWLDMMSYLRTVKLLQARWSSFLTDFDINRTVATVGSIGDVLKLMTGSNLPASLSQLIDTNEQSLLLQSYIMDFLNLHLTKINGTKNFVLLDYVNSSELSKLFKLLEEVPNAVKVLLHTILRWNQKPEEIQNLLTLVNWGQMCNNSALFNQIFATDILGKEKADFHGAICNRVLLHGDFSKILSELNRNVDGFSTLYSSINQLYKTNYPPNGQRVNYTNMILKQIKLQNLIDSLITNPPQFDIGTDNSWLNVSSYTKDIKMFLAVFENEQMSWTNASLSTVLATIGESLNMAFSEIPASVDPVLAEMKRQLLIQTYWYNFINFHLEKITVSKKFILEDFLNSKDIKKLVALLEESPDVIKVLLNTILHWNQKPQEAEKLLSTVKWDQVCNNSAVFSQIFATDVLGSRAAQFQAKVCASVSFQELFNRPWMETLSKIHGFERYITLIDQLYNASYPLDAVKLNFTKIFLNQAKYQSLIDSLIMNPPQLVIGTDNSWMNVSVYQGKLNTFLNIIQLYYLDERLPFTQDLIKLIAGLNKEMLPTGIAKQLIHVDQNLVILHSVMKLINPVLKNISQNQRINILDMANSEEMVKILSLLQVSPDSVEIFLKLAMKILQNPQRILPWLKLDPWKQLCHPSTSGALMSSLFGNVSASQLPFAIKQIHSLLCSFLQQNVTLETFISQISPLPGFSKFYKMISTNTFTNMSVNSTALVAEVKQFQGYLMSLSANPPVLYWNPEKILLGNDSLLLNVLEKWNKEILSSDTKSIVSRLKILDDLLSQHLPSAVISRFQMVKKYLLIQQSLMQLLNQPLKQINATGEFILMDAVKSEELKKIISLVLASPGMANLLLETSLQLLNDYQKISSISNPGTWQNICNNPQLLNKVFNQTVAAHYYVNLTQLQSRLCKEVNGTKLWIELQQNFDPSGQITHLLMPTRNVTIDYTAVAHEVTLFYDLLLSVSSHKMLTFKVTKDEIWWSDNFNKLIESFVNTTKMQPIQFNSTDILKLFLPGLQPVLSTINNSTEWQLFIKTILDSLNSLDMVLDKVSGAPSELEKLLIGYPEVTKMVQLMNYSNEAVSGVIYNVLIQSSEIIDAVQKSSSFNSLCTALQKVNMITPPGSTLNINHYLQLVCSIDFVQANAELLNLTASAGRQKRDVSSQENLEMLLKKLEGVWQKLSSIQGASPSTFWKPLIFWVNVTFSQNSRWKELLQIFNQPQTLERLFESTLNFVPALLDVENLRPSYHLLKILLKGSNDTLKIYSALISDIWRNTSQVQDIFNRLSADSVRGFIENNIKPFLVSMLKLYNISEGSLPLAKLPIGDTVSSIWKLISRISTENALHDRKHLLSNVQRVLGMTGNPQSNLTRQLLQFLNMTSPQADLKKALTILLRDLNSTTFTKNSSEIHLLLSTLNKINQNSTQNLLTRIATILMSNSKNKGLCQNEVLSQILPQMSAASMLSGKVLINVINSSICNPDRFNQILNDSNYGNLQEMISKLFLSQILQQLKTQINGTEHILKSILEIMSGSAKKSSNSAVIQDIMKSMANNNSVSTMLRNLLANFLHSANNRSGNNSDFSVNLQDILTGSVNMETVLKQLLNKENFDIYKAITMDPMQIFGLHLKSIACELTKTSSSFPGMSEVYSMMCKDELITLGYQQALAWIKMFNLPQGLLKFTNFSNANMSQQEYFAYFQNITGSLYGSGFGKIFNESQLYRMCELSLSNTKLSANGKIYLGFVEVLSDLLIYQSHIIPDIEKALCDNSTNTVVKILEILQQSDYLKLLQKFKTSALSSSPSKKTCAHLAHLASKTPAEYERFLQRLQNPTHTVKCLRRRIPRFAELVNNFDMMIHVSREMLQIIQDPSLQSLVNNQKLAPLIAVLLNTILQNKPVIVHVSHLLNDSSQVENYLLSHTSLPYSIVQTLLNSSINMKMLQVIKESPKKLKDILCNPTNLMQYIHWPGSEESLQNFTKAFCENFTATTSGLKIYLDTFAIKQKLSLLDRSIQIDIPWLVNISRDMAELLENIQRLLTLEVLFNSLTVNQLSRLIPEIQQLAVDNVPEKIVKGVTRIINDFKVIDNRTFSPEFMQDVKVVMQGILGLSAVEKVMALSAVFKDFLKSPNTVRQYLTEDLALPQNISNALMDSTVSLAQFIHLQSSNFSELLCFNLSHVLTLSNDTDITYGEISQHLCHIDKEKISNLTQIIMEQLHVGEFVKQYVLLQANAILSQSNMTMPSAKQSLSSVARTSAIIQKAYGSLSTTQLFKIFSEYIKAESGDYNAFSQLVPVMCGRNVSLLFKNQNKLLSVSPRNEIKGEDGLTHLQRQEMNSLPNVFCRHLYKDIIKTQTGEILWKFVKPLVRGKILFTPDTEVTRYITNKVDKVFQIVGKLQEIGAQWKEGIIGVSNMKDKINNMTDLFKYLKTPFVQDLMKDMFDVNSDSLMSSMKMLDQLNNSTLSKLQYLIVNVINYTSCMSSSRFVAVSSSQLEKRAFDLSKRNEFLAAVIFQDMSEEVKNSREKRDTTVKLPKHIQYKIRMDVDNIPFTGRIKERYWRPQPEDNFANEMRYFRGFIQLQDMIERAIVETHIESSGKNFSLPGIALKQFPFPCHMKDEYLHILSSYLMPIMMTLAWLASLGLGIRNFVKDRQGGQEEALLVMGMYSGINWLAWVVSTMLMMSCVCVIIVIILHFSTIFSYSNLLIMFLYFVIYCFSTTMMCYMVSSFFTNSTLAVLTGLIFYLFSYMPYVLLQSLSNNEAIYKFIASLSSTTAFSYGSLYLSTFEEKQTGIQWDNINQSHIEGDKMNFSMACMMMLIDSVFYCIIGWYVKNTKKRKYGIPKPWNFPFTLKYWRCNKSSTVKYHTSSMSSSAYASTEMLLEPPLNTNNVGITLMNLSKNYKDNTAVNNLCLDFFNGEITTLLGQNGAGKTTTFQMMSGIMEASGGEVIYCDSNRSKSNSWFGICPQQNVLFDYMTAEEHIRLYAGIKAGLTGKLLEREVRRILKDVDLLHMRNVPAKQLSGGMQRRLCVALAFTGRSKIVILDEPTAGVDPSARRGIWDLILKYRAGCTVILSTHHLDEADILSDRIAILHKGKLLCSGSSLFLKRHLGTGYHLTLIKNNPDSEDYTEAIPSSVTFNPSKVLDFIRHYIPGSEISENYTLEATYTLPVSSNRKDFSLFFEHLDKNLAKLGVKSYGISDTTLEEVFMKARDLSDAGIVLTADNMKGKSIKPPSPQLEEQFNDSNLADLTASGSDFQLNVNKESSSALDTFTGLLMKRAYHYYRNWRLMVSSVLLPCLFFTFAIGFSKISRVEPYKSILLSPELYGKGTYAFYKNEANDAYGKSLQNAFSKYPGLGTCCMPDVEETKRKLCVAAETQFTRPYYPEDLVNKSGSCSCMDYRYDCSKYAAGIPPSQILLNSSIILQNLTPMKESVPDYLLTSFAEFVEKRYGGWTYNADNGKKTTTVWFNNKGHHALPGFLNSYSNAILRMAVNATKLGNPAEYGITLYNNPIKLSLGVLSEEAILHIASETVVSLVILLAFSFIPAGFCIYLVKEHRNSEKYLFFISGVRPLTYWIAAFFWDMVAYCVPLIIATIILSIFKLETFWVRQNLPATVLLLFMFGWSAIPFMYTMVRTFKDTTSAYMIVFCLNIFIGMSTSICIFLLSLFQRTVIQQTAFNICKIAFLIFPQFCTSYGLVSLGKNQLVTNIYEHFGKDVYENPFYMLRWNFFALALSGVVFFVITLIIEARNTFSCKSKSKHNFNEIFKEDEDVQHERMRTEKSYAQGEDAISIVRLTKIFQQGFEKILAVKRISFGVRHGECFGLLGVNGAGKTTTFRILTGEMLASSGDVYMFGESLSRNPKMARNVIGYCPQEDALDNYLTGRELLAFYAKIRGISKSEINSIIAQLVSELHLENFANKLVSSYSGGMKRKLSLAIALLGDPPLVLLDEPTAGMDPGARRLVWNCINRALHKGQSVILTSHSMEECDMLCTRLCIMVNGQFKCLGSPQHLKNKFSKGYTVTINMMNADLDITSIKNFMKTYFPETVLKESHNTTLVFSIPKSIAKVSKLFALLEEHKENLQIKDYAISQTTLDMVFVGFANEQSDGIIDRRTDSEYESESFYAYENIAFKGSCPKLDDLKYLETSHL